MKGAVEQLRSFVPASAKHAITVSRSSATMRPLSLAGLDHQRGPRLGKATRTTEKPRVNIPEPYMAKIRSTYPDVPLNDVQLNSDGMVNDVIVINQDLVCRFVRDAHNEEQLASEAATLSVVNEWVDLSTPRLEHLDASFASYRYIPGEPLTHTALARLSSKGRERVVSELAAFHTQLHGIPTATLAAANVPASPAQRSPADWLDLYDRVRLDLFPHLWTHQKTWVDELFAPLLRHQLSLDYSPTLIHGDLAVYHIFHDPDREALTGVIDFGVAGLGDPACDIAIQLGNYGDGILQQMVADNPQWSDHIDRARFWAATFELQWATAGLEQTDLSLMHAHIGGHREMGPVQRPG